MAFTADDYLSTSQSYLDEIKEQKTKVKVYHSAYMAQSHLISALVLLNENNDKSLLDKAKILRYEISVALDESLSKYA